MHSDMNRMVNVIENDRDGGPEEFWACNNWRPLFPRVEFQLDNNNKAKQVSLFSRNKWIHENIVQENNFNFPVGPFI